jgi:hypothetical protein
VDSDDHMCTPVPGRSEWTMTDSDSVRVALAPHRDDPAVPAVNDQLECKFRYPSNLKTGTEALRRPGSGPSGSARAVQGVTVPGRKFGTGPGSGLGESIALLN